MKKVMERMQEPTPKFFKTIRNLGLVLTAVGSVIATAPVSMPTIVITIAGYIAVTGGNRIGNQSNSSL